MGAAASVQAAKSLTDFYTKKLEKIDAPKFQELEKLLSKAKPDLERINTLTNELAYEILIVGPKVAGKEASLDALEVTSKPNILMRFFHGIALFFGGNHRKEATHLEEALDIIRQKAAITPIWGSKSQELRALDRVLARVIERVNENEKDESRKIAPIRWRDSDIAEKVHDLVAAFREQKTFFIQHKKTIPTVLHEINKRISQLENLASEKLENTCEAIQFLTNSSFEILNKLELYQDAETQDKRKPVRELYQDMFVISKKGVEARNALYSAFPELRPKEMRGVIAEWDTVRPQKEVQKALKEHLITGEIDALMQQLKQELALQEIQAEPVAQPARVPERDISQETVFGMLEKRKARGAQKTERAVSVDNTQAKQQAQLQKQLRGEYLFILGAKGSIAETEELSKDEARAVSQYLDTQTEALNTLVTSQIPRALSNDNFKLLRDTIVGLAQPIRRKVQALYRANTNKLDPVAIRKELGLPEPKKAVTPQVSTMETRFSENELKEIAAITTSKVAVYATLLQDIAKSPALIDDLAAIGFGRERTLKELIRNHALKRYFDLLTYARQKRLIGDGLKELQALHDDVDEELGSINDVALVGALDEFVAWSVNNQTQFPEFAKEVKKWLTNIFAEDSESREVIETLFRRKEVTKEFQFSEEVSDLLKAIMQKAASNRIQQLLRFYHQMIELPKTKRFDMLKVGIGTRREEMREDEEIEVEPEEEG